MPAGFLSSVLFSEDLLKMHLLAGEMAQPGKCSAYKHEDQSSIPTEKARGDAVLAPTFPGAGDRRLSETFLAEL